MFAPLPKGFPKLQTVVQAIGAVAVAKPPAIEAIGQRLRAAYSRAEVSGYRDVSAAEVRKLPYAYWVPPDAALPDIHPDLVGRYWQESLPAALGSGSRRAKRWLTPLFFTYCASFDPGDKDFLDFAQRIVPAARLGEGAFAERMLEIELKVGFFQPAAVPARLANALLTDNQPLEISLSHYLLWPGIVDTRLGDAVLTAALKLGEAQLREWDIIARLLDWESRLPARIVRTPHRVQFADALLRPWRGRHPTELVKSTLTAFFVQEYGDPRIERARSYQWLQVAPDALAVLMNWLAGDTLKAFMRVLEQTADEIWRYRQKFWMGYYNAGYIEEAWLVLGTQAQIYAHRLQQDEPGMGFGHLDSGAAPNQSVLLLKIGHLVFTEWSHNGSLRAYMDGEMGSPRLYQRSYHGSDLREPLSMDFHDGMNQNPELRHMNSHGGTWQRKARDFIRRQTGIHLNDWEIA